MEIVNLVVFPFNDRRLAHGGDQLWSREALPHNDSFIKLPLPKTDYYVGYPGLLTSQWDIGAELAAADHFLVQPYAQPTGGVICPSYLVEVKSKVKGGTLYAAENHLASAGAHSITSMHWFLNQMDPSQTRSCTDAIVFSHAVNQRQAILYAHWYNPADRCIYMSYVKHYYWVDDIREFHAHSKNLRDWLVDVQGPYVRDVLRRMFPVTRNW